MHSPAGAWERNAKTRVQGFDESSEMQKDYQEWFPVHGKKAEGTCLLEKDIAAIERMLKR